MTEQRNNDSRGEELIWLGVAGGTLFSVAELWRGEYVNASFYAVVAAWLALIALRANDSAAPPARRLLFTGASVMFVVLLSVRVFTLFT